jgi:hypothetical protein
MFTSRAIAMVAMLVLLAGCSVSADETAARVPRATASVDDERPEAAVRPEWTGCPPASEIEPAGSIDQIELPSLPANFVPSSGFLCRAMVTDSGTTVEEKPLHRLGPLTTAFRLPSEKGTPTVCTAEGFVRPWIALIDADGRWVQAPFPLDLCRHPLPAALAAFGAAQR